MSNSAMINLLVSSFVAIFAAFVGALIGAKGALRASVKSFELAARRSKEVDEDKALYEVYARATLLKAWLDCVENPIVHNGKKFDGNRLLEGRSPYNMWMEIVSRQVQLSPTRHADIVQVLHDGLMVQDAEMVVILTNVMTAIEKLLAPQLIAKMKP